MSIFLASILPRLLSVLLSTGRHTTHACLHRYTPKRHAPVKVQVAPG